MTCCSVGRWQVEREREWTERKSWRREQERGGERETRVVVEVVEGIGEVKWSCRVALAKLTPHSPDQSRQVGR